MAWKDLEVDLLELFAAECPAAPLYRPPDPGGGGGVKLPRGMHLMGTGVRTINVKPKLPKFDRVAWKLKNAERLRDYAVAYRLVHRKERALYKKQNPEAAKKHAQTYREKHGEKERKRHRVYNTTKRKGRAPSLHTNRPDDDK